MNKYYRNMILCSELDYYCLLCKESFETISDVEKHIRWEKHRQSIKYQNNIPKYKEFIHKIGEIYYCEICNCVVWFKTLQGHMKSDDHKKHKANPGNVYKRIGIGKRDDSSSIKFPQLSINRLQWHGIHKSQCSLCNETIGNVNEHINMTKHMVLVIQSEVVENSSYYFRKLEDNIFHCFGCSVIINKGSLNEHNCRRQKEKNNKRDINKNSESKNKYDSLELDIIACVAEDSYDINITEKTAKCRLCDASVEFSVKALSKHTIEYHEDTIQYRDPVDHGKRRSELAKYGKENFIKLNQGGSLGYCTLCDIDISAHMNVTTEHVNGLKHRGNLELKGLRPHKRHSVPACITIRFHIFLRDMFHAKPWNTMCINYSLCIDVMSLIFIITLKHYEQPKRKCFCCDVVFDWDDLNEHLESRKHKSEFASTDVLLMDEEFIRVVRPGLFHCGFCNQVYPFWECMEKHIASRNHGFAKKKNKVLCILAMKWYIEEKPNCTVRNPNDLFQ